LLRFYALPTGTRLDVAISFFCPFCEKRANAPDGTRGKWGPCPTCKVRIQVPQNIITPDEYLAQAARAKPEPSPSECPYCHVSIDPRPKRGRKCKSCGEAFYVRQGSLFTAQNARVHDEQFGNPLKWMDRQERFHYHRHYFAREFLKIKQNAEMMIGATIIAPSTICCSVCHKHHKRFVPVDSGKHEDLPPFSDCTNDDFCPCILRSVFRDPKLEKLIDFGD
jgi:hypothetical protein